MSHPLNSAAHRWAAAGALALLAAASAALVGAGTTAAAAGRAAARAAADPSRCTATGLVVWLDTRADAAAGSSYYRLELTNLSGRSCTLLGFPGVSAVDIRGAQLGDAATRSPGTPVRRVTLASGATASAVLRIAQAANYPAAACRQATAAGLRVYPPGETHPRLVPFPFPACSRSGPAFLAVGPVTAAGAPVS